MLITVDPRSSVGLASQIAAQVRAQIASGTLAAGDRLPPARELARGLQVNMHTVLRAYATLQEEGLIDVRRGRGAHVSAHAEGLEASAWAQFNALLDQVRRSAERLGLSDDQLVEHVLGRHHE